MRIRQKRITKLIMLLTAMSNVFLLYIVVEVHGSDLFTKERVTQELTISHTTFSRECTGCKNVRDDGMMTKTVEIRSTVKLLKANKESRAYKVKPHNATFSSNDRNSGEIKSQHLSNYPKGSVYRPLNFIPHVPPKDIPDSAVPYLHDTIVSKFLVLPATKYTQRVVILTPIRNAERTLETFRAQLLKLSYPRNLLSVYFGESGSTDSTFKKAENITKELEQNHNFNDSRVIDLRMPGGIQGPQGFRHELKFQKYRRSYLAIARNRLVRYALQRNDFDYVLAIDSDIEEFPKDLVQQMMFAKSDIVGTSCLVKSRGYKFIYDRNSWRETNASLEKQASLPLDHLVLEGYDKSYRQFLPELRHEGRVVKLDGVGGCALMVKADCFRSGLLFPEVVYKRHIETEGLAKMGLDMGFSVVGLPFVEVFHHVWA